MAEESTSDDAGPLAQELERALLLGKMNRPTPNPSLKRTASEALRSHISTSLEAIDKSLRDSVDKLQREKAELDNHALQKNRADVTNTFIEFGVTEENARRIAEALVYTSNNYDKTMKILQVGKLFLFRRCMRSRPFANREFFFSYF